MTPIEGHHGGAVAQFLGPEAARGGPCALLGLPLQGFTDLDVIQARDERMQAIDAHPQSQSPAADEVRLALYAATAQLLNPAIRSHFQRSAALGQRRAAVLGLEQDVMLTLGMFGGWTRKSLPRLVALAHARGLQASDVADTVRRIGRRRASTPGAHSRPPHTTQPDVATVAVEPKSAANPYLIIGVVALISIALAAIAIRSLVATPASRVPGNIATDAPAPGTSLEQQIFPKPVDVGGAPPPAGAVPEELLNPDEILDTLLNAIAAAHDEPSKANAEAIAAVNALAASWLDLSPPVRTRAHDAVVELMYRLGGPTGDARELLAAIGKASAVLRTQHDSLDRRDVAEASWSIGMMTRLRRERDLAAQSQAAIDRWLGASLGGARPAQFNFDDGVIVAAQAMIETLLSQPDHRGEGWKAWAAVVQAATLGDSARRIAMLTRGAEQLLTRAVEPEQNAETYQAIGAVISAMPWRGNIDTTRWFVRQFDNHDVSAAALSAATRAVVAGSDAENIDPTMVLSATASDLQRRELRDRYLLAWNLEQPGSDAAVLDELTRAADQLDDDLARATASADEFRAAIGYARLSAAAAAQWQGDAAAAAALLKNFRVPANDHSQSAPPEPFGDGDADWAEKYLALGAQIEPRLQMLNELRSRGSRRIGAVNAEVIVADATRGNSRRIREAARDVLELYGSSPAVVNALLEEAPRIPPTPLASDLVVSITATPLPNYNSPGWRPAVRRALVERLLQLLAADTDMADIDLLAALLDEAYNARATTHGTATSSGDMTVPSAQRSAMALRARWMRIAERTIPSPDLGLSADQIERRRIGRASLAHGLAQEFAVEEVALAETMAFVIASERPDRAPQVRLVLDRLAEQRQQATHIFEQIADTERAMIDLWRIRLGAENP